MFDIEVLAPEALAAMDDAALITAITACAAAEAAAAARTLAVIGEFTARRLAAAEHADWACDDWDAASVEIGAALTMSLYRASGQMDLALTLRDRLPAVAALFAAGQLPARTVIAIAKRSDQVVDPEALAAVDTALAEHARAWGALSQKKLEAAVDLLITVIDPDAVRRTRRNARDREIHFGDPTDGDGITTVWARLLATDAELLEARLTAMARMVCANDPRTQLQRLTDALGALGAGRLHLACRCGSPACPAAADDGRASSIVVHVLTDTDTAATATPDPACHGEPPDEPRPNLAEVIADYNGARRAQESERADTADAPTTPAEAPEPVAAPSNPPTEPPRPALIVGGPLLPAPLLADLIAHGATVRPLIAPGDAPQPRYRPSTALDLWVRCRDLTCRAPGCDRPAIGADIDHTVPWPYGPTHPSNNAVKCRKHHLAKTFWPGFSERQNPDGTVEFTTPTGHTYTTRPYSRLYFPAWATTTGVPPAPTGTPPPQATGQTMPKRKRTRAKDRQYRIDSERTLNHAENPPPPF